MKLKKLKETKNLLTLSHFLFTFFFNSDSEIAMIIEDTALVESRMNGEIVISFSFV